MSFVLLPHLHRSDSLCEASNPGALHQLTLYSVLTYSCIFLYVLLLLLDQDQLTNQPPRNSFPTSASLRLRRCCPCLIAQPIRSNACFLVNHQTRRISRDYLPYSKRPTCSLSPCTGPWQSYSTIPSQFFRQISHKEFATMPGVDMAPLVADDTRGKKIRSRVRCQPTPLHPYPFCAA